MDRISNNTEHAEGNHLDHSRCYGNMTVSIFVVITTLFYRSFRYAGFKMINSYQMYFQQPIYQ